MANNLVLIVDDDPVFARLTRDLLAGQGHEVVTAFNKAEALELFEKHGPSCAILDIVLPDGSGVDLVKSLRSNGTAIPIIMVPGQEDVEELVRAMKDGANDFLKKPFRGEELILKIQMVLETTQAKWELEELKSRVRHEDEFKLLFSLSERMSKVREIVEHVANTDITVLITGENGTGKELVAKALHKASDRANEPFVKVNCAVLPRDLLEGELFGFGRGAFADANRRKHGRFEMAQNGTIFLDEISEMHRDLQSKLLRVLQEKQFFEIGGEKGVKVNCRFLSATNKNLDRMVEGGRFRRDLYYRINVVNILVPPLRERKDDIPLMVDYFLTRYSEMYGRERSKISPRLSEMLMAYSWPGNVRELENMIKRLVILGHESQLISELMRKKKDGSCARYREASENVFRRAGLRAASKSQPHHDADSADTNGDGVCVPEKATLKEVAKIAQRNAERVMIERVLRQTRWNRRKAAQLLDISYKALLCKIKECGPSEE